jgi:hypothetical protein
VSRGNETFSPKAPMPQGLCPGTRC